MHATLTASDVDNNGIPLVHVMCISDNLKQLLQFLVFSFRFGHYNQCNVYGQIIDQHCTLLGRK